MIKKECRLTRAARYYLGTGGGATGGATQLPYGANSFGAGQGFSGLAPTNNASVGISPVPGGSITQGQPGNTGGGGPLNTEFPNAGGYHGASMFRTPSSEAPILQNWFNRQIGNYGDFRSSDALLGPATSGALDFFKQLPGMLGQFKGFGNELSGYQNQLTTDQKQLGGYSNQLGGLYGQLGAQGRTLGGLISSPFGPAAITATGGALTDQMARDVSQQTRGIQSAQGTAQGSGALGTELLNRDAARQARYNTALQQEQGLLGQQQGVYGQQANVLGQRAGITGQSAGLTQIGAGLTGQKAGLLGQVQALQTGGLNQLLGVGNAAVSQYTGLTQPVWNFLSNLFSGNQQAAVSEAQIEAQKAAAGSSKKGGGKRSRQHYRGGNSDHRRVMTKIEHSTDLIRYGITTSNRPAAMLSFGKDSMAMAHLIRGERSVFPIDVIYHRDPWFAHKNEFADGVIRSWNMSVHDYPPFAAGVKVKPDMLELVSRYNFGPGFMDIPKNVCSPGEYPRRQFICGLNDWILRPKSATQTPWDMVFIGHRSADVDPFEGAVPLKSDSTRVGKVNVIFPLRDWSDEELWDYIRVNHVPVQEARYNGDAHWYGNDWTHACTLCIDPRETRERVMCPKLGREVKNRGGEVLQLHARPDYWEKEKV